MTGRVCTNGVISASISPCGKTTEKTSMQISMEVFNNLFQR